MAFVRIGYFRAQPDKIEDAVAYDQSGQAAAMVGKIRHTFAGPPELVTCEGIGI